MDNIFKFPLIENTDGSPCVIITIRNDPYINDDVLQLMPRIIINIAPPDDAYNNTYLGIPGPVSLSNVRLYGIRFLYCLLEYLLSLVYFNEFISKTGKKIQLKIPSIPGTSFTAFNYQIDCSSFADNYITSGKGIARDVLNMLEDDDKNVLKIFAWLEGMIFRTKITNPAINDTDQILSELLTGRTCYLSIMSNKEPLDVCQASAGAEYCIKSYTDYWSFSEINKRSQTLVDYFIAIQTGTDFTNFVTYNMEENVPFAPGFESDDGVGTQMAAGANNADGPIVYTSGTVETSEMSGPSSGTIPFGIESIHLLYLTFLVNSIFVI